MKRISYTKQNAPDKFVNEYGWKGKGNPLDYDHAEYHLEQNLIGKSGNDWYKVDKDIGKDDDRVGLDRMDLFNFLNVCVPSLSFDKDTISMLKPDFVKKNFNCSTYENYTKNKKAHADYEKGKKLYEMGLNPEFNPLSIHSIDTEIKSRYTNPITNSVLWFSGGDFDDAIRPLLDSLKDGLDISKKQKDTLSYEIVPAENIHTDKTNPYWAKYRVEYSYEKDGEKIPIMSLPLSLTVSKTKSLLLMQRPNPDLHIGLAYGIGGPDGYEYEDFDLDYFRSFKKTSLKEALQVMAAQSNYLKMESGIFFEDVDQFIDEHYSELKDKSFSDLSTDQKGKFLNDLNDHLYQKDEMIAEFLDEYGDLKFVTNIRFDDNMYKDLHYFSKSGMIDEVQKRVEKRELNKQERLDNIKQINESNPEIISIVDAVVGECGDESKNNDYPDKKMYAMVAAYDSKSDIASTINNKMKEIHDYAAEILGDDEGEKSNQRIFVSRPVCDKEDKNKKALVIGTVISDDDSFSKDEVLNAVKEAVADVVPDIHFANETMLLSSTQMDNTKERYAVSMYGGEKGTWVEKLAKPIRSDHSVSTVLNDALAPNDEKSNDYQNGGLG